MKKKALVMLLVGAMAAATVMSGCGGNSDDASSATAEESTSASADAEDTEITTEELLSGTDYDVTQYVVLPEGYMNQTITLENSYEVTDEDVRDYVEELIASYPNYVKSDKTTVEEGDIVNIDYVGKLDGEAFDGGTAEDYNLTIGSDTFIDGFEDGLIGVTVGSVVDLNLTFPDNYSSTDLAGQDVVFTVTVNGIMQEEDMTYDSLTDDYVAANFSGSDISTVEDLLSEVEASLESYNEQDKQSEEQELILQNLIATCEVNIPDGMLDERVSEFMDRVESAAESYGITSDEYLTDYVGMSSDEVPDYIEENLKEELILEAIVADQQITISQDSFDYFVSMYISYYGYEDEETFYNAYGGEAYVKLSYAENQVLSELIDNATVNEAASSADVAAEEAETSEAQ